jgi:DNA adenine methylase
MTKPILKWAGGKSKLLKDILPLAPTEIVNYHEPFLGGGSVLLGILNLISENKLKVSGKIYAYDLNDKLINVYNQIKNAPEELYEVINFYETEYNSITSDVVNRKPVSSLEAKTSKESYYYWIRSKYNSTEFNTVQHAGLFLFLNKTCFRGLYREGPNGFNVPFGNYKSKLCIVSKKDLKFISSLIKDVNFIHLGFSESLKSIKPGDFVYLDPPYVPENKTSFVGYTSDGFNLKECETLFESIKKLKDSRFLMSNSDTELVRNSFTLDEYKIKEITARRAINSKKPGSTTTELLIGN